MAGQAWVGGAGQGAKGKRDRTPESGGRLAVVHWRLPGSWKRLDQSCMHAVRTLPQEVQTHRLAGMNHVAIKSNAWVAYTLVVSLYTPLFAHTVRGLEDENSVEH